MFKLETHSTTCADQITPADIISMQELEHLIKCEPKLAFSVLLLYPRTTPSPLAVRNRPKRHWRIRALERCHLGVTKEV